VATNNKDLATAVLEMKHREQQKRAWQKINFVTKPRGGGITRFGVPEGYLNSPMQDIWEFLKDLTSQPTWVYITDPVIIEAKLIKWQTFHYNQAANTPFVKSEIHDGMNPLI